MMKPRRRRTNPRLALKIARAQLRAIRSYIPRPTYGDLAAGYLESEGPARFIQCWAVSGRPVTQALDSSGQVWERIWRKRTETTPEESWWEPLSMDRRQPKKEEKA